MAVKPELLKRFLISLLLLVILIPGSSASNLAYGKTPTTINANWDSGAFYPTTLSNVVDNNFGTRSGGGASNFAFSTQVVSDSTYIQIDLLNQYDLSSITLKYEFLASGAVTDYHDALNVSSNGSSWIQLYSNTTTLVSTQSVNKSIILSSNGTRIQYIRFNVWKSGGAGALVRWYEIQAEGILSAPELYAPQNGSAVYYSYPPQTSSVNFTWHDGEPSYHLLVAKDSNFNLLSVDTTTNNNYSVQTLTGTQQYWWKVRRYNSTTGVYGDWSNVSNFTLTANTSATGTGVQGVVYELVGSSIVPISGALVKIANSSLTWSSEQTVGSNGYFLFTGLNNDTSYILSASKIDEFEDSGNVYFTVSNGNVTTQNIMLQRCVSGFNCFYNKQYITFTVQSLFGTVYPGVTATVYKGNEIITSASGVTGTDGRVTFLLMKDQSYRITFVNASLGISKEITIVASDTQYIVIVSVTEGRWQEHEHVQADELHMNVTKEIFNSTHAFINVTYLDDLSQTTSVIVYLNQSNRSDPNNQTTLATWNGGAIASGSHSFEVTNYEGQQYIITFVVQHTEFGTVKQSYSVFFKQVWTVPGIPDTVWGYLGVILIVFLAAVFTASTVEIGGVVICGIAWVLYFAGWYDTIFNPTQFGISLTLGTVIAIFAYISRSTKKERYA